jgi:Universal stress protein family
MITQKSMVIEVFVESGPKIGKARLKAPPEQKIQQILVPVDPANDCRTHKDKWLERVFLGRHADRILADAPCPVLVVREEETDFINGSDQA